MAIIKARVKLSSVVADKLKADLDALQALIDEKAERIQQKAAKLELSERAQATITRKTETKKRILLGGALLALSKTNGTAAAALELVMRHLEQTEKSDSSRKALGFAVLPKPKKAEETQPNF